MAPPGQQLAPGALVLDAPVAEAPARARQRSAVSEPTVVFAVAFAAFVALGVWLTVHLQVVPYDSAFRLAHALFVWHGAPGKLSAIGFVWPPLMTLVFLPFAAVKPLATSLIALPLTSAVAAAGTLAVLARTFKLLGMPRRGSYPLIAAFAVNPMFIHYATNGMSEMWTFLWLLWGLYYLLRWHLSHQVPVLALSGIAMALGLLSRYELAPYIVVMGVTIFALTWRKRGADETESSLLLFGAPVVYGLGVWLLLSYMIIGDPLYFLHHELAERFVLEQGRSLSEGGAHGANAGALTLARLIVELYGRLFLPQLLVLVPLAVVSVVRRSGIGVMLIALVLLNPLMTYMFVKGSDLALMQLRFNTRSMPLTLAAIGWLFYLSRGRMRAALIACSLVSLLACIPLTWQTMKSYPYVFAEHDFVRAIETGEPHDPIHLADARTMASYINAHVHGKREVLVDDSQTFLPLLLGGHPELYFDRIDKGDTVWRRVLKDPRGKVGWMLVPFKQGPIGDLILARYPGAPEGAVPFLHVVFTTQGLALLRVAPLVRRPHRAA
jgi:hypothetical protein